MPEMPLIQTTNTIKVNLSGSMKSNLSGQLLKSLYKAIHRYSFVVAG